MLVFFVLILLGTFAGLAGMQDLELSHARFRFFVASFTASLEVRAENTVS